MKTLNLSRKEYLLYELMDDFAFEPGEQFETELEKEQTRRNICG